MKPRTLAEIARIVGGTVVGDATVEITGVAPLDEAHEGQLALFADRRYAPQLTHTRGGALLVSAKLASEAAGRPAVVVEDAHAALTELLPHLHPEPAAEPGVHPTAVIATGVRLGRAITVGPYAVLEADCVIGDRVRIGAHAVVGRGCRVGDDSLLHPQVVLYPGVELGRRVLVHAGARLGSDGFGYAFSGGAYRKIPQVGRCVVEDDVEIGANTCLDRGSIGDTVVGQGSKLDNLVHVAHNCRIGSVTALAAQVGLAGSARVGSGVVLGGQAGLAGHIEVGDGAKVGAQAGVIGDIPAGATVGGYPARDLRTVMKGMALVLRLPELFKRLRALEATQTDAAGPRAGKPRA